MTDLVKIVVESEYPNAGATMRLEYPVASLGPTPARQRAAARVALVKANGGTIVQYFERYSDGTIREIE